MKKLLLFLLLIPFLAFSQTINKVDIDGKKQGVWVKKYENGERRYKGSFKDDIPHGVFKYYYNSGELQASKEFFHKGKAASTHFYYLNGKLKASGLYVNQMKDSTWNYYNESEVLILSEQYKGGGN